MKIHCDGDNFSRQTLWFEQSLIILWTIIKPPLNFLILKEIFKVLLKMWCDNCLLLFPLRAGAVALAGFITVNGRYLLFLFLVQYEINIFSRFIKFLGVFYFLNSEVSQSQIFFWWIYINNILIISILGFIFFHPPDVTIYAYFALAQSVTALIAAIIISNVCIQRSDQKNQLSITTFSIFSDHISLQNSWSISMDSYYFWQ